MNSLLSKVSEGLFLCIAHRGARSLAPENTLCAAAKALHIGADLWELDVMMTADGELVVIHDRDLDRTSNAKRVFPSRRPWRVNEFTLEEIRLLDFGSWFEKRDPFGQIAAGLVHGDDLKRYRGERAPQLREALEFTLAQSWYVNVEIKDLRGTGGHDKVIARVVDEIARLRMEDRVLLSSFNHGYLKQAKALNPSIPTGVLVNRRHVDPVRLMRDLGVDTYHPRVSSLKAGDMRLVREQGIPILAWVVNDEVVMRDLIKKGVNGIFTDFPQLLVPIIRSGDE